MKSMQKEKFCALLFLAVGIVTVWEFVFVQGMFTWLPMVTLVILSGGINVILALRRSDWIGAALFTLCVVALCMGYFTLA